MLISHKVYICELESNPNPFYDLFGHFDITNFNFFFWNYFMIITHISAHLLSVSSSDSSFELHIHDYSSK